MDKSRTPRDIVKPEMLLEFKIEDAIELEDTGGDE